MTHRTELPPSRRMPETARLATRQLLEGVASTSREGGAGRWLSRGVVIGAATGLALTGGAAVAFVAFAPATDLSVVRCFTLPEVGTEDDYYGTDAVAASPDQDGPVPVTEAVALCADLWRQGALTYGVKSAPGPDQSSTKTTYPIPELTACVLDSGIAGVFPADADICSRLGLAALQP